MRVLRLPGGTAIDELTREHDFVVTLIGQVRDAHKARDVATMAALARPRRGPRTHTAVEEQGLFPALAADFPDHVAILYAEHRRIESVLAEAAKGTPDDPSWRASCWTSRICCASTS